MIPAELHTNKRKTALKHIANLKDLNIQISNACIGASFLDHDKILKLMQVCVVQTFCALEYLVYCIDEEAQHGKVQEVRHEQV